MIVYILYHYWDTPDDEGNEVIGAYRRYEDALVAMTSGAETVKSYFADDFWDDDMTWEDDCEIHLGYDPRSANELATVYCWRIERAEVK